MANEFLSSSGKNSFLSKNGWHGYLQPSDGMVIYSHPMAWLFTAIRLSFFYSSTDKCLQQLMLYRIVKAQGGQFLF
jgi:hypothetical protein